MSEAASSAEIRLSAYNRIRETVPRIPNLALIDEILPFYRPQSLNFSSQATDILARYILAPHNPTYSIRRLNHLADAVREALSDVEGIGMSYADVNDVHINPFLRNPFSRELTVPTLKAGETIGSVAVSAEVQIMEEIKGLEAREWAVRDEKRDIFLATQVAIFPSIRSAKKAAQEYRREELKRKIKVYNPYRIIQLELTKGG